MTTECDQIVLRAGEQTEDLANFLFRNLSDGEVDQIDLKRERNTGGGVARELITASVILTLTPILAVKIFRLIERYMENQRQKHALEVVYTAASKDSATAKVVADLAKKHAEISIKYGLQTGKK